MKDSQIHYEQDPTIQSLSQIQNQLRTQRQSNTSMPTPPALKVNVKKSPNSFQSIMLKCQNQNQSQIIQKHQLKALIMQLLGRINLNKTDIETKIQSQNIHYNQVLDRIISKQAKLAEYQEGLKYNFIQIERQLSYLDLKVFTQLQQKIKLMSDQLVDHEVCSNQKFDSFHQLLQQQRKNREKNSQEIQFFKQKIINEQIFIQNMKKQIYELQNKLSESTQYLNIKSSFPEVQLSHIIQKQNLLQQFPKSFSFSNIFKNKQIRLINSYSIEGTDDSRGKIALIQPSIMDWILNTSNQNPTITLKVKKFSADILFGICDIEDAKGINYKVGSWNGGHGGYYMNSSSYSYSSYRSEDNNKMKGFKFYDGQEIKVMYVSRKKKIKFSNDNQQFSISLRPDIELDRLYFGVIMHKDESIVQIVQ